MTPVDWAAAKPHFEDIVAVFLSTANPTAQRIDGSGGDGGRDIQIRSKEKLDIYECKSFTGRIGSTGNRRKQVEKSLARAATLNPSSWTLVVPIDPTPAEESWFSRLQERFTFPLFWYGRTWLDAQSAKHPRITRYFLEGTDSEVVQLLRELHREDAALAGGARDGIERLRVLKNRLDELDPYYRANLALDNDVAHIELIPRYRGAEADRPIVISTNFAFSDSSLGEAAESELRRAIESGTGAHIPEEFVSEISVDAPMGLGGSFRGEVVIGPATPESIRLRGRIAITRPNGRPVAALPIIFAKREKGTVAGTLTGTDLCGAVTVTLKFNLRTKMSSVNVRFDIPEDSTPGSVLPALRWASNLKPPNLVSVEFEGHQLGEPSAAASFDGPSEDYVNLVADVDFLQAHSGEPFPVPLGFSGHEVREIRRAVRLARGEVVRVDSNSLSFALNANSRDGLLEWLGNDTYLQFAATIQDYSISIGESQVHIGPVIAHVSKGRIANADEIRHHLDTIGTESVPFVLEVDPDGDMSLVMGELDENNSETNRAAD